MLILEGVVCVLDLGWRGVVWFLGCVVCVLMFGGVVVCVLMFGSVVCVWFLGA